MWPFSSALAAHRSAPVLPLGSPEPAGPPWDPFEGPLETIPAGRTAMIATYGDLGHSYDRKGSVVVSRAWERANMITARGLPGYDRPVYVHRQVEPYLREALRRAKGWGAIERLGCFAPRHQRHDKSLPLSDHSWGIAVDINAEDNQGRYPKALIAQVGRVPKPWDPLWHHVWPAGVTFEFVEAFESVGFEWAGRWTSFVDPMHFQLRKTR
jgi:hypothetical protein